MAFYKRKKSTIKSSINWEGHIFEGCEYEHPSSSGSAVYTMRVEAQGPVCDCPGFVFNGNCKHVKNFIEDVENA